MRQLATLTLAFAACLSWMSAANASDEQRVSTQATTSALDATMADGEVKKIDKDAGKITIKHGPLTSLDMPAMTMVFRVADPAMLDQVKAGDKIRFLAERKGGLITVTKLEAAQ